MRESIADNPKLIWPENFLWGAATSAHQVEGGNVNDWSEWEIKNAEKLARDSERKFGHWLPHWDKVKDLALSPQNYISGHGSDHYNRFEEDFDILQELGLNSYRFSIEWSRLEPQFGKFDQKVLDHYLRMIDALKARNIEPVITLWHWTHPLWFRDLGGWENRDSARYFADFAAKTISCCLDAKYWITLNEPEVYASQSYLIGDWPPQKRRLWHYFKVTNNLIRGHNYAADSIRQIRPGSLLGVANNLQYMQPHPNNFINRVAAGPINWWWNHYILERIKNNIDFIGVNYYFMRRVNVVPFLSEPTKALPQSDLGWELFPEGLYRVLMQTKRYHKPVIITEHGLADADDHLRGWYIKESLQFAHKALEEGVDLRGYLHWSLLDNFEWDKGYWPRFGLVDVDYQTKERRIRASAREYAELIRN